MKGDKVAKRALIGYFCRASILCGDIAISPEMDNLHRLTTIHRKDKPKMEHQ